jgi:hypothetical protein
VPLVLELLDVHAGSLGCIASPYGYTHRGQGRAGYYVATNETQPGLVALAGSVAAVGPCGLPARGSGYPGMLNPSLYIQRYPALNISLSRTNLDIQRASQHLHAPRSTPTTSRFSTCIAAVSVVADGHLGRNVAL